MRVSNFKETQIHFLSFKKTEKEFKNSHNLEISLYLTYKLIKIVTFLPRGLFMLTCIGLYTFLLLIMLHPFPAVDNFLQVNFVSLIFSACYCHTTGFKLPRVGTSAQKRECLRCCIGSEMPHSPLSILSCLPRSCVFPMTGVSLWSSLWSGMRLLLSCWRYGSETSTPCLLAVIELLLKLQTVICML